MLRIAQGAGLWWLESPCSLSLGVCGSRLTDCPGLVYVSSVPDHRLSSDSEPHCHVFVMSQTELNGLLRRGSVCQEMKVQVGTASHDS
jgi:hypothetical protein